ncbi:MAG: hypothetical protein ACYTFI_14085, partial [Planctomycetota bacterium]
MNSKPGQRRRFFAPRVIVVLALCGPLLTLLIVLIAVNYSARKAVERELGRIHDSGDPATMEELQRLLGSPIPDEENAAVLFKQAAEKLEANEEAEQGILHGDDLLDLIYDAATESRVEQIRELVALHADAMGLMRAGLGRAACRYEPDAPGGRYLIDLTRLFAAEALLHSHEGCPAKAAASLEVVFGAAGVVSEQMVVDRVVCVASEGAAAGLKALEKTERSSPLPDAARRSLIRRLERIDFGRAAAGMAVRLRAETADESRQLLDGESAMTSRFDGALGVRPFLFLQLRDAARFLALETEFVETSRLPVWERLPRL